MRTEFPSKDLSGKDLSGRPSLSAMLTGVCDECTQMAEADHRIANHLAMLAGYVRLRAVDPPESTADAARILQGLAAQISAVGELHRSLVFNGRFASTELAGPLRSICAPFASVLPGSPALTEDLSPACSVRPDQVLPIMQIVVEAITNAIKYAYPPGEEGVILVRCGTDPSGAVQVEVSDNGRGLPDPFDPGTDGGRGFHLMRSLGRKLNADLSFRSDGAGLRILLILRERRAAAVLAGELQHETD